MTADSFSFVRWFRHSSPYIHAHRGRTFVVTFGGEAIADGNFASHVHDFALLNSLGIRLVLVHGIRPQIDQRLIDASIEPRFKDGLRITDAAALHCVKEAAGTVRVELEALLSMGLPNSPMAGAKIRVASGNFVTAKPLGVRDGTDFCHTGQVRKIDAGAITEKLDRDNVVLLSPIGYSPSGEVFNLSAEEVATEVAVALRADKFLLMTEQDCINRISGERIQQITTDEVEGFLESPETFHCDVIPHLKAAVRGCREGVGRAHLINRKTDGALLLELFTRDGIGTLVSSTPFEKLRTASIRDIGGILDLITPLETKGVLVKRSRESVEMEIEDYSVIERDGMIIGCAALHAFPQESAGELACVAIHPDYRGAARAERLLDHIVNRARQAGLARLFALTTQTTHWFIERGFVHTDIGDLPVQRQRLYNYQRNSKVLSKCVTTDATESEKR